MVGYHQTSWKNWECIREKGLQLYRMDHEDVLRNAGFELPVMGIWIWQQKLDLVSLHMNVLFHAGKKKSSRIVSLSVQYEDEDLLRLGAQAVIIKHHLSLDGQVKFFENSKATILGKPVPMSRIKLLQTFDWKKYIER